MYTVWNARFVSCRYIGGESQEVYGITKRPEAIALAASDLSFGGSKKVKPPSSERGSGRHGQISGKSTPIKA